MRLSDIMSGAGLSGYAQVALIIFFIAFVAIAVWIFLPSRRAAMDAASRLPLDNDTPPASNREGVVR